MKTTSILINKKIAQYGEKCIVKCGDNESRECFVVLKNLIQNIKTRFESLKTPLGIVINDYYSAYFDNSIDILKIDKKNPISINDKKYLIIKREEIIVGGIVVYYWAILKKIQEEDDAFEW